MPFGLLRILKSVVYHFPKENQLRNNESDKLFAEIDGLEWLLQRQIAILVNGIDI